MKVTAVLLGACLLHISVGYYTEEELQAKFRGPGSTMVPTKGQPWPKPQYMFDYQGYMIVRPSTFQFKVTGADCKILRDALKRYMHLIVSFTAPKSTYEYKPWKKDPDFRGYLDTVEVRLMRKCDEWPELYMDEHYVIKINNPDVPQAAVLTAESVWGIIRGLETLVQLMVPAPDGVGLKVASVMVEDFPRFPYRGLMLDTSRHYLPVRKILETIELMAMNKFNVFHWHLVDDQSFPYQSSTFPNLSGKGAFNPVTHIYSRENVSEVIEYARVRGIRVIPEFDTPGHTESWGPGQPGLLTPCYDGQKPDGTYGPIDPTNERNFRFLRDFFHEVRQVFPDKYMHLGGDEVSFMCWESNPDVRKFMEAHNFTGDYTMLEEYYIQRLVDIIADQGSDYLVWQEVVDNGVDIDNKTIVHIWKGGYKYELNKVTSMGYQAILSSCWYLNYISYGIDWHSFYECDPHDFFGTPAQKELVRGGEACMWSEYVDATNLTPRLWPRASAVAERLWSSNETTDPVDAEKRLEEHRCRLLSRGYPVEPVNGPGFCEFEWNH